MAAGLKKTRRDAVVMADWVVTLPPDVVPADQGRFFQTAYDFIAKRYGEENMLGGFVHLDETTPHMHVAFMPVVSRDVEVPAFSAKRMLNRLDLQTFHSDLSEVVENSLGYPTSVLLDDKETFKKLVTKMKPENKKELQAAYERVLPLKELEERLEYLQQAVPAAESRVKDLGLRNTFSRVRIGELRERISDVRERIKAFLSRDEYHAPSLDSELEKVHSWTSLKGVGQIALKTTKREQEQRSSSSGHDSQKKPSRPSQER